MLQANEFILMKIKTNFKQGFFIISQSECKFCLSAPKHNISTKTITINKYHGVYKYIMSLNNRFTCLSMKKNKKKLFA